MSEQCRRSCYTLSHVKNTTNYYLFYLFICRSSSARRVVTYMQTLPHPVNATRVSTVNSTVVDRADLEKRGMDTDIGLLISLFFFVFISLDCKHLLRAQRS